MYNRLDKVDNLCIENYTILFISLYFLKKDKNIHRGEILKTAVGKSGQKVEQVAKKAGYKRSTYYTHIEKPGLDLRILEKYGKAMSYDFTEEVPEMNKYILEDPPAKYIPRTFEEAINQLGQLREKYDQLNEKYKQLNEEHNLLHNKYDQFRDEYIQYLRMYKGTELVSHKKSQDKS